MKSFGTGILTALILVATLYGCKKYEEGPALSFRSKETRVVNNWKAKYVLEDRRDITAAYADTEWDIREDGRLVITFKDALDSTQTQEGFWALQDNKETLQFVYADPPVNPDRISFKIVKLKEDELWIRNETDSLDWEFRLIPADTTGN